MSRDSIAAARLWKQASDEVTAARLWKRSLHKKDQFPLTAHDSALAGAVQQTLKEALLL